MGGDLPSIACRALAQGTEVDTPAPHRACRSARRRGHCSVAKRTMARTPEKIHLERRTLVFVDEPGFYLLLARVRTYAPRGQPPTRRMFETRDHLSVMSAVTSQGRLRHQQLQDISESEQKNIELHCRQRRAQMLSVSIADSGWAKISTWPLSRRTSGQSPESRNRLRHRILRRENDSRSCG
jgi:hypothetical protein